MTLRKPSRTTAAVSAALGVALVLAGCSGGGDTADSGAASDNPECANFEQYGDLSGETINVYTSIVAPEDQSHIDSYDLFEECTGAQVVYEGSAEFEAQLVVRIRSGNPPDIAYMPQPGLLQTLVNDTDAVQPVPDQARQNVEENFPETFANAFSVDGTLYATPLGANVKSFVWYSPSTFAERGYEVPQTWDEMIALSDRMVADGIVPWCAGIGSGDATGWPLTDFLEDVVLREGGVEVYDQWVSHEIPFNDPQIVASLDRVGDILKNAEYVNGGLGDVQSIATTTFQDGGLPILQQQCGMHRQANFYAANWPEGTDVSENGDIYAFQLPPINPDQPTPILVGGEGVASFSDRPAVQAFQAYLASAEWANEKAKATTTGGWISAHSGLDTANLTGPIDILSVEILQNADNEFRFDGSDLMPGAVGAGTFWRAMTDWVTGQSSQDVLTFVEGSWPS